MRICVLGGTRFIGRAIVDALVGADHEVLVVHRGTTEPAGLPDVPHLHADRRALAEGEAATALHRFAPEGVVDCMAIGAADTDDVLGAFPDEGLRLVTLSSMDVYRAYGSLHAGVVTDAVPLDETSPVREQRYPYRGQQPGMDDYDKLDVEDRVLARGGVIARLPMVTGPHDYQVRQEFVLRRVRHGRRRIPIGAGNALLTHGDVADVADGVVRLLRADDAVVRGEVFNLGEARTPTMRLRAEAVLAAAAAVDPRAAEVELVRVPDEALPPDLGITAAIGQHLLVSSTKATERLGWRPGEPGAQLARTVAWHLEHDLPDGHPLASDDFAADDEALARATDPEANAEGA